VPDPNTRLGIPDFGPAGFEVGDVLRWETPRGPRFGIYVQPGREGYSWIRGTGGEVLVHNGDLTIVDMQDPAQVKEWLHG